MKTTPAASDNPTKRFIEPLRSVHVRLIASLSYFFTHALVAESHFMSVSFLHSALVFGGSAANAGAVTPKRRPATIAVLRNLGHFVLLLSEGVSPSPEERCAPLVVARCLPPYEFVWGHSGTFWRQHRSAAVELTTPPRSRTHRCLNQKRRAQTTGTANSSVRAFSTSCGWHAS